MPWGEPTQLGFDAMLKVIAKRGTEIKTWLRPDPREEMLDSLQRAMGRYGWEVSLIPELPESPEPTEPTNTIPSSKS